MPDRQDKMRLGMIIDAGSHAGAWRHPDVPADAAWSFDHTLKVAQSAERGLFDMVFFADSMAMRQSPSAEAASRGEPAKHLEPLLLLAGLAVLTRHVGLVTTATTTYYEPYHLARFFASLDIMSGGRAGWNLVTSQNPAEAQNFGLDAHPRHADRYDRAREFAETVYGLWDSWDDDAFLYDKADGRFFDPAKLHPLHHRGEHFTVSGPLNVPRSLQGRPIVTQAGSSEAGRELGAATADVIFTAQHEIGAARAFRADVTGRLARFGREPGALKVLAGLVPIVGRSRAEAEEKLNFLNRLIHPQVGLAILSGLLGGADLSGHDLDGPLPDLPVGNNSKSRQALMVDLSRREGLSIRQLYERGAVANGHRTLLGTPTEIADDMERWFREGAVDGFVLIPAWLPGSLDEFVDEVVPELQRRGLFRTAYEGTTLRQNLGLPWPEYGAGRRLA